MIRLERSNDLNFWLALDAEGDGEGVTRWSLTGAISRDAAPHVITLLEHAAAQLRGELDATADH